MSAIYTKVPEDLQCFLNNGVPLNDIEDEIEGNLDLNVLWWCYYNSLWHNLPKYTLYIALVYILTLQ